MEKQLYVLSDKGLEFLAEQISKHLKGGIQPSNDTEEDVFLTIEEVALLISLSKFTIYGLVHKNKIPYHKQGKRLYFLKSEILEWIKSGKRRSQTTLEEKANEYLLKNRI
ncbi:helix-turn-helix domain-containing protein [Arenibacter palladensis]|uniref:helix-turn-helix domain-containing protein n=1 Tax=Arenibacter palladensis TaxID=237373 RepID=UPI0026E33F8E|nr:helix-turn-helix domain-containing protein [Arenibacter palladensis]MDO6604696.1 helix-turn-helix domain-containing protein [Arenibacter palladensis]